MYVSGYKNGQSFQYTVWLSSSGYNAYHEAEKFMESDFLNNQTIKECYFLKKIEDNQNSMKECKSHTGCMKYIERSIGTDQYDHIYHKLVSMKTKNSNCVNSTFSNKTINSAIK